ncbi:MAG: hypothetical protein KGZ69_03765 [Methylomonas sp.]|nr:hypothetical protein [Methylomonas sp.]
MPYFFTALGAGIATLWGGVKQAFGIGAPPQNEGITPTKVIIYGGAALSLYLILKKNKLV